MMIILGDDHDDEEEEDDNDDGDDGGDFDDCFSPPECWWGYLLCGGPLATERGKVQTKLFFSLFFFYFLNENFSKCVASLLLQNYGSMVPVMERYWKRYWKGTEKDI